MSIWFQCLFLLRCSLFDCPLKVNSVLFLFCSPILKTNLELLIISDWWTKTALCDRLQLRTSIQFSVTAALLLISVNQGVYWGWRLLADWKHIENLRVSVNLSRTDIESLNSLINTAKGLWEFQSRGAESPGWFRLLLKYVMTWGFT